MVSGCSHYIPDSLPLSSLLTLDMAPFYESLCAETGRQVDSDLLAQLKAANKEKLASLEEAIEDSEKNFGETEQKEALQAKAEYLCRIGHKARAYLPCVCTRASFLLNISV